MQRPFHIFGLISSVFPSQYFAQQGWLSFVNKENFFTERISYLKVAPLKHMQFQKRPCYLSIFHHLLLSNCCHFLLKLDLAVAHPLMKRAQLARGRDPTSSWKPGIKSHNRVTSPGKSGGGTSLKCFSYILPFPRINKSNLSVFFY